MPESNPNPTRPAALYLRVSTARQEDEGTSLATQEAACRRYCAERGYPVVAVYREVHTGADLFERSQLSALRAAVRAGEVGVVVAHALDRLSRQQAHLGLISSEVEHAGAAIELVTEKLEDTPEGRLLQSVRGFVAEVERLKTRERTQRGLRARVESGKMLPGPRPPFGYLWADPKKTRLVENPITAPIVQRIFTEVASGVSGRKVAQRLTADAVPTPTGKAVWSGATVTKLVKHPVYAGRATAWRWQRERVKGEGVRQRQRPSDEQMVLDGAAPALVSPDVAAAAVARLGTNKVEAARNNPAPEAALLRGGFARCGFCGGALTVNNGAKGGPAYHCGTTARDRHGCPGFSIKTHILDAAAWRRAWAVLVDDGVIGAELARLQQDDPTLADLTAIERRLVEVGRKQAALARMVAALSDEPDAAEPLAAELRALAGQRRQLEQERAEVEARRVTWQGAQDQLADLRAWRRSVAANLDDLSYDGRRLALRALGAQVLVWNATHTPRYDIRVSLPIVDTTRC